MKKKEKKAKSDVKKPIYKRWWFWVIIVVILAAAFGGNSSNSGEQSDDAESSTVESEISSEETATAEENSTAEESTSTEESEAAESETAEDSEPEEEGTESHIYDNATVKDVMNGTHTEKLGEYSIIYISSAEATVENLTDWYYNYVEVNDYNWCMILYTDSDENKGVYGNTGMVEKDIFFKQDEYGDYSVGDSSQETFYLPENGTLVEYSD